MSFKRQFWLGMTIGTAFFGAAYGAVVAIEFATAPEVARSGPLATFAGSLAFVGGLLFLVTIHRGFARLLFVRDGKLLPWLFERLDYPLWHWWLHIDATGKDRDA